MYGKIGIPKEVHQKESPDSAYRKFETQQNPGYAEKKPTLDKVMLGLAQVREFLQEGGTLEEIHVLKSGGSLFDVDDQPPIKIAVFDNGQRQLYIRERNKSYEVMSKAEVDRLMLIHKCVDGACSGGRKQLEKLVSGYGQEPFVYRKGMFDDSGTGDFF